jgi:hypothetical protein
MVVRDIAKAADPDSDRNDKLGPVFGPWKPRPTISTPFRFPAMACSRQLDYSPLLLWRVAC